VGVVFLTILTPLFIYRNKQGCCDLVQILKGLEPFYDYIEGISVESTWVVLAGRLIITQQPKGLA
jgi:hypothetical protein